MHLSNSRSDCGDPGLIASGQRELTGTAVGETANFSCFQGFRMEGAAIRECQQNGLWSGSLPTCTCESEALGGRRERGGGRVGRRESGKEREREGRERVKERVREGEVREMKGEGRGE